MPSFPRKAAAPSASVPVVATMPSEPVTTLTIAVREPVSIPSVASACQLLLLVDEDDISLDDDSLIPRKRRAVDVGGERTVAVGSEGCDFILREISIVYVGESPEAGPEVLHLEEMNMSASVHPVEDVVEGEVHNDGLALPR